MAGKYDPWDQFFAALSGDSQQFGFAELEELTGVSLPPSARRHAAWWSNAHHHARWAHHGWFASARVADEVVTFTRSRPPRGRPPSPAAKSRPPERGAVGPRNAQLILLGCVNEKRSGPLPAKELYASPLWERRRTYAEASGEPWRILSAEFGLVDPDEVLPAYDRSLATASSRERAEWARHVLADLLPVLNELGVDAVEIHAGSAYVDHGLAAGLEARGIKVRRPLQGLRIGEQLAWYRPADGGTRPAAADGRQEEGPSPRVPSSEHAHALADTYRTGTLGESWNELPEVWNLPDTDLESRLLWLTFVCAMDRAREAKRLWAAAHTAWDNEPWVFDPAEVAVRPLSELMEALRRHGLSQRHTVDSAAWRLVGEALVSEMCPLPIRQALGGGPVDAMDVLSALDTTWPQGSSMFPLLSGPKIAPMWIRMLAFPGGAAVTGMEQIPVAVDTHVHRVTEMLGLVQVDRLTPRHRQAIQTAWFQAVGTAGSFGAPPSIDGTAAGLDPAIWALGKQGCTRCEAGGRKIEVGPICELCVLGRLP